MSQETLRVGLIGTGYVAKARAAAFHADSRSQVVATAGHRLASAEGLAASYGATAEASWQSLIERSDIDLVAIASANRDHGKAVQGALQAGKHVVVEYPLALDFELAESLVTLARQTDKLLHIEHIELLGSLHQTVQAHINAVGQPVYVRYATISPQHPAPSKWTYDPGLFGFPLMGALSRVHRLTNLFGRVATVACQNQVYRTDQDVIDTCLCSAQVTFASGPIADVVYGKGDRLWKSTRTLEIQGSQGTLLFDKDQGVLINAEGEHPIAVAPRHGLFVRDTTMVLDHLENNTPLYIKPEESLYALEVADAARRSAETGQTITLSP
ncbi:MAG: Gfo/Idh/MocA family oxidoreductase [Cyanobacteria bacterium P01_A01_bin.123]